MVIFEVNIIRNSYGTMQVPVTIQYMGISGVGILSLFTFSTITHGSPLDTIEYRLGLLHAGQVALVVELNAGSPRDVAARVQLQLVPAHPRVGTDPPVVCGLYNSK
jgi:DNA topoisomerase VI subunit B